MYPVLENKCSLSGMEELCSSGEFGLLDGLLVLLLRERYPVVDDEGVSSINNAAMMANNTRKDPNRNGAPENCRKMINSSS